MSPALAAMLSRVASWPDTCEAGVTRDGDWVPCDKPAIGVYIDTTDDGEFGFSGSVAWPVCVHHARVGRMASLRDLLSWQGTVSRPSSARIYADLTGDDE